MTGPKLSSPFPSDDVTLSSEILRIAWIFSAFSFTTRRGMLDVDWDPEYFCNPEAFFLSRLLWLLADVNVPETGSEFR